MNYLTLLLQANRTLFHTQDLRVLWGISNSNTLYTTIKRYIQRGVLFPVQKGLYSTLPLSKLDPWALGVVAVHAYAYVSCESVLAKAGYLNHIPQAITLVGPQAKKFELGGQRHVVRQLADQFLFRPEGVVVENGVRQATAVRALADLLYFNPHAQLDASVPWGSIRNMQKDLGYPVTKRRS